MLYALHSGAVKLITAAAMLLSIALTQSLSPAQAADFAEHKSAVVYFSLLNNRVGGDSLAAARTEGLTEHVGALLAAHTGADSFALRVVHPYANDFDEVAERSRIELEDQARPELASIPDLSSYDVIFLGFPL